WPLPKNSSHITQPLDAAPFAVFKNQLRAKSEDFMLDKMFVHQDFNASNEVIKAALIALREAVTPAVIKKGFTATCLWPFNERVFTHHVLEALADVESQDSRSSTEEFAVQLAKLHEATEDGIRA